MDSFVINERITINCAFKKTRTAFKHTAELVIDGQVVESTKICYLNRTWEQYTYQSVIHKLIDKSKVLPQADKDVVKRFVDGDDGYNGEGVSRDMQGLKAVGSIMKLGEILHSTNQEKQNDWKERMLKAGLQNSGLEMPHDWGALSEEAKTERLNKAMQALIQS